MYKTLTRPPGSQKPTTMQIESKPLLLLNMMAFTALIEKLQRNRKSMPLKTVDDRKVLKHLEKNISESKIMLEAIENELINKH